MNALKNTTTLPLSEGEIAGIAKRIGELIELVGDANRAVTAAPRQEQRRKRNEARAWLEECDALRDRLAVEFGSRFGWRRAKTGFWLEKLGRKPTRWYDTQTFTGKVVDHPTCFRGADPTLPASRNRGTQLRAASTKPSRRSCVRALRRGDQGYAASFNLEATIVTDFPSWYWPGHTTLVLYRPRKTLTPFGPAPDPDDGPTEQMIREGENDVAEAAQ